MTDEQLTALLRLKRFEQPPEGYFDELLRDVHRRQREELLRRPLWQIAWDRWQTFFGEHSMGPLSYAGAMAAVVIAGLTAIGTLTSGHPEGNVTGGTALAARSVLGGRPESNPPFTLRVEPGLGAASGGHLVSSTAGANHEPRYIIDARPVSYDASSLSF